MSPMRVSLFEGHRVANWWRAAVLSIAGCGSRQGGEEGEGDERWAGNERGWRSDRVQMLVRCWSDVGEGQ